MLSNLRNQIRPAAVTVLAFAVLLAMFTLLRSVMLMQNVELLDGAPLEDIGGAFLMGLRFDMRVAVYAVLPLLLSLILPGSVVYRISRVWLLVCGSLYLFLGLLELRFYMEFQQRLNDLVFQYLREDTATVISMVWYGEPVIRYVLVWIAGSWLLWKLFRAIDRRFHRDDRMSWMQRSGLTLTLFCVLAVSARGTLGSGPPLRWGDAYQSDVMFLNHLGLNGVFTLTKSEIYHLDQGNDSDWLSAMSAGKAEATTRELLLLESDRLIDEQSAPVRRRADVARSTPWQDFNVVIILMESFSAQYVGALGNRLGVTPEFDRLADEGVLFTNFLSNGTHTHQGIFATLACFPNLPGYEYLMQQPEGRNHFSGISTVLSGYQSLFVYNGDFSWDNQAGFFRNQGMKHMVGRYDFEHPRFVDPVWGVSDEDMFTRAVQELDRLADDRPFVAVLQTLSNHLPYAIPQPLAFAPVTDGESISERLTAMKYSDWALGQFFRAMDERDYAQRTLFVVLGDHSFGMEKQLTSVNLLRFHVPLLIVGPGLREEYGARVTRVASQVDVIPTILGLLGGPRQHQCWGRDQFALTTEDPGFAIIKPSGGDPNVALVRGDRILTLTGGSSPQLYRYSLAAPAVVPLPMDRDGREIELQLRAYVQTALTSLAANTTGAR